MMGGATKLQEEEAIKAFELLGNRRCFYTILALREASESISIEELAREVALKECGRLPETTSESTITRVQHSLYHVYLPKLQEENVVEYRSTRDLVRVTKGMEVLNTIMDSVFGE